MLHERIRCCFLSVLTMTLMILCPVPRANADLRGHSFRALDSDSADHSCQVVLRRASLRRDATGRPVTEADSSGQLWFSFESMVDAGEALLASGSSVMLLYRTSVESHWHSAPGLAIPGGADGMQRIVFKISEGTFVASSVPSINPDDSQKLHLIPYLQTTDGRRIFDHNSNLGDFDSITLDASNDWSVETPAALCPTPGRGSSTLRFLGQWTVEQRGLAQPGQGLYVEYDLSRLPQCQGSSYNGLPAWQTDAHIRFYPSGDEFSSALNALVNGKMTSTTARFEIPVGSTHAQLWFKTKGRNCETTWDSNFGRNYEIAVRADVTPAPAWAGQWRMLSGTGPCFSLNKAISLNDDFVLTDSTLNVCHAIESEVFVPGVTNSLEASPEIIQAQVVWSVDGQTQRSQWLTYAGRSGQNYRFRWMLPSDVLKDITGSKIDYSFRFSTDGVFWLTAGRLRDSQNGIVVPRRVEFRTVP